MVAQRVPGELAHEPVVLVEVRAWWVRTRSGATSTSASRRHPSPRRRRGKYPSRKRSTTTDPATEPGTPPRSPRPRLPADAVGAQDDPVTSRSGPRPRAQERPAAADLDVVGVRPQREHAEDRPIAVRAKRQHQLQRARGDDSVSPFAHTLPGRSWTAASASRRCLSFIVSIGSQKPSYRYAISPPLSASRCEGLDDKLLAGIDVVEDVAPQDHEPAVDPDVRLLMSVKSTYDSVSVGVKTCALNIAPDGDEDAVLPKSPEALDHVGQRRIREPVAIRREKVFVIPDEARPREAVPRSSWMPVSTNVIRQPPPTAALDG